MILNIEELEKIKKQSFKEGYDEGHEIGFEKGYTQGMDYSDSCLEARIDELEEEVDELKYERGWFPISERLPIRNGCYNVTRIIEGTLISDVCYFDGQNTWHRDVCVNHGRPYLTDIIAWRPLPEPYKEN